MILNLIIEQILLFPIFPPVPRLAWCEPCLWHRHEKSGAGELLNSPHRKTLAPEAIALRIDIGRIEAQVVGIRSRVERG